MMRLSVRRSCALALVAALAVLLRGTSASAQDSSLTVRIGLTYAPGTKPGVLLLPVSGANGDSIRAILQRELDYSDRANVLADEPSLWTPRPTLAAGDSIIRSMPAWEPRRWCRRR